MMKSKLILAISFLMMAFTSQAQTEVYGDLQPLHVDGNNLKDPFGNKVVLHGVMDTPSPYFNGNRWGGSCKTDDDAKRAVRYFNLLFDAITDHDQGAYCTLFRLHLDPCWLNTSSSMAAGFTKVDGKVYDPNGTEVSGEANISNFSEASLKQFLKSCYIPIAEKALAHGLYIIMRPPGVFPSKVKVGDYYNDYIMKVWDIVTQDETVKKYAGQIMIELGNEPVSLVGADGNDSENALHDFFQPVVDKMRANGYNGVIWVPGTGWQANYRNYAKCPITGPNIGYAVHNYVGWYNGNDRNYSAADKASYAESFRESCPIIGTNPIVITEVDWSPEKEGTGHYNEHGEWVLSNYGTWATGTTSKWGSAYKYLLDKFDNISMTLSGTACYIDIDSYWKYNKKKVVPAFKTAMEKNGLDPAEGSGVACMEWYADYAKVDYSAAERYQPVQQIDNPVDVKNGAFVDDILYANTVTKSSSSAFKAAFKMKAGGFAGWRYEEEEGVNLSYYKYLCINFVNKVTGDVKLRIYDSSNYWDDCYTVSLRGQKEVKIDLSQLTTASGRAIDLEHVRMIGLRAGSELTVYMKDAFLSVDGENPATGIDGVEAGDEAEDGTHYSVGGQLIPSSQAGVHIVRMKDGKAKKVIK